MKSLLITCFVLHSALASLAWSQESVPVGDEFQINTYTTGWQSSPSVAADAAGNFVVLWSSSEADSTDTSYRSIQGQRYEANGTPLGGQFQINSYTTGSQNSSDVAADGAGNFVVVWTSEGSYGTATSYVSIQGQRFDNDFAPIGNQFQVNSYTTAHQARPEVAADAAGNFVVVWDSEGSYGTDTSYRGIQGQRFDQTGTPLGNQFQINTYTTHLQWGSDVAADAAGNFVVVWKSVGSPGTDNDSWSAQGQRFDSTGVPVGDQFQVNTYTTGTDESPVVAMGAAGNFVVVWAGTDGFWSGIQGQRYKSDGTPVGSQFQINSYTSHIQKDPAVVVDAAGNFVVVWTSEGSYGSDSSDQSIQGQRYDSDFTPLGNEFQVNSYTTGKQLSAAVATLGQGDWVVVWYSEGSHGTDTSGSSIQGRQYLWHIYADSFESGDLSAWSSTVQ